MPYCPRCHADYAEGTKVCWSCHVFLVAGSSDDREAEPRIEWTKAVPVYLAPDEFSALRIKSVLEEAEIAAQVESAQIPWVDGIMFNIKGYWGRVLVHPDDRELAVEIVDAYLASVEGAGGGGGRKWRAEDGGASERGGEETVPPEE